MQRNLILIESTPTGFSAYSPDLPGCVAAAATPAEIERAMRDAIELHLDALREAGQPVPTGSTSAAYVEVAA